MVLRPGDLTGPKPRQYGVGRRCPCGVSLSRYNAEELCTSCQRSPRPEGVFMEPETMKVKQVVELLGVSAREVRELADKGSIEVHRRGRGLWGSTYLAESVRAYHDQVTLERFDVEVRQHEPEAIADRVAESFEPECPIVNQDNCCGQPEACVHTGPDEAACPCDEECCTPEPEGSRIQFGGGSFWLGPAVDVDPEIEAMDAIRAALETLDNEQRIRAVEWAIARFEIRKGASA